MAGCTAHTTSPTAGTAPTTTATSTPSGCQFRDGGLLPDPTCTPGVTLPVTAAQVCTPGYSATVRNVSEATKLRVRREYGLTTFHGEIDHLVSLELGGSNDIRNLWPEAGPPTNNVKDKVEGRLHAAVCAGRITLAQAQHEIATDWTTVRIP